ncbi:hypothetical protein CLOM_g5133 [Closterium sp. NIES-68]|nr:hypothetical protein CLOM_g5133 [Closterium sp. NIES-68]
MDAAMTTQSAADVPETGGDCNEGKASQAVSLPDAWRERFRDLITTHLRMDGAMQQQATELFSACYALLAPSIASFGAPESPDDSERAWSACILFVVRKLGPAKAAEEAAAGAGQISPPGSSRSQWPWFTLSELLRATKLTVVDFFKEIANFLPRVSSVMQSAYGDSWEQRLEVKELQANFVHAIVLFNHYKKVHAELFTSPAPSSHPGMAPGSAPPPGAAASQFSREMRFGWLLFLSIKAHLLRRFPDLVTATNAMLCTLVVLIVHVPPSLRRFSFSDPVRFPRRAGRERLVDVVGSLCASYKAADGEVAALLERTHQLMERWLGRQATANACEQQDAGELCTDRLFLFEGLLQDPALLPSVDLVEGAYQEAYVEAGDRALDERMFLSGDSQVIGAVSQLTAASSVGAAKRSMPPPSPLKSAPMGAMNAPSSPFASTMGAGGGGGGAGGSTTITIAPFCSPARSFLTRLGPGGIGGGGGGMGGAGGGGGGGGGGVPGTPISAAMSTAHWLRTVVSASPAEPSLDLLRFLHACDKDVTGAVVTRTTLVSHEIFAAVSQKKRAAAATAATGGGAGGGKGSPGEAGGEKNGAGAGAAGAGDAGKQGGEPAAAGGGAGGSDPADAALWAEQRRQETVKLYYRVLLRMCTSESLRMRSQNLTPLLDNDRFHRALLACSAELVLASHKATAHTFPAVLAPAGVSAFDMDKVMEGFVRYEEGLPGELKRHLNACDERILESLAWEKGSSLYVTVVAARRHLLAEVHRLQLLPEGEEVAGLVGRGGGGKGSGGEGEKGDGTPESKASEAASPPAKLSFAAFSPMKPQDKRAFAHLHASFTTPFQRASAAASAPPGESRSEMLFNQFCQKVLKLAVVRVRSLCERLRLTAAVSEMVFRVVEHAVEGEVQLLFCRHLDQIILSSVYGVCKVSQVAVTFKDIIAQYRKLPHCKPSVFRNVFIDAKPPPADSASKEPVPQHGDIIRFYNEIFVPATKSFLLQLGQGASAAGGGGGAGGGAAGGGGGAGGVGERGAGHGGGLLRSPLIHSSPALAHFQQHQQSPSSVPGASPRRVSSRHNVYVSPLPTSRMEALLASPHRQLSAQLSTQLLGGGLSADPFASPSRHLAAINQRISSTRRLGRLDFSDAMDVDASRASSITPPPPTPVAPIAAPLAATTAAAAATTAASTAPVSAAATTAPVPAPVAAAVNGDDASATPAAAVDAGSPSLDSGRPPLPPAAAASVAAPGSAPAIPVPVAAPAAAPAAAGVAGAAAGAFPVNGTEAADIAEQAAEYAVGNSAGNGEAGQLSYSSGAATMGVESGPMGVGSAAMGAGMGVEMGVGSAGAVDGSWWQQQSAQQQGQQQQEQQQQVQQQQEQQGQYIQGPGQEGQSGQYMQQEYVGGHQGEQQWQPQQQQYQQQQPLQQQQHPQQQYQDQQQQQQQEQYHYQ